MMHPEELLAAYVDGTLVERERAEVESHLASCERCRDEISTASRARDELRALSELEAPMRATWPVIREVRRQPGKRRFEPTRWVAGLAAAAAISGLAVLVFLQGTPQGGGPVRGAAPAASPAPAGTAPPLHLGYVRQNTDYDHQDIGGLASRIAKLFEKRQAAHEQKTAVSSGSAGLASGGGGGGAAQENQTAPGAPTPAPAEDTAGGFGPSSKAQALACITKATGETPPGRNLAIIDAAFEGTPAYIGAFVETAGVAPEPQLVIWVASKQGCSLLSFAQKPLS